MDSFVLKIGSSVWSLFASGGATSTFVYLFGNDGQQILLAGYVGIGLGVFVAIGLLSAIVKAKGSTKS